MAGIWNILNGIRNDYFANRQNMPAAIPYTGYLNGGNDRFSSQIQNILMRLQQGGSQFNQNFVRPLQSNLPSAYTLYTTVQNPVQPAEPAATTSNTPPTNTRRYYHGSGGK